MSIDERIHRAQMAYSRGESQQCLTLYYEALEEATKSGTMFQAMVCHRDMAKIYDDLGEYQKAIDCCDEGLKEAQLDTVSYAGLCINKGVSLIKLFRFEDALECFTNASNRIGMVPPKLRTSEMHSQRDTALGNRDVVRLILKAKAEGKKIGLVKEEE
jgi:tetratricopeptide (TPR) repeat protein